MGASGGDPEAAVTPMIEAMRTTTIKSLELLISTAAAFFITLFRVANSPSKV